MKNKPLVEVKYLVDYEIEAIPDLKNSINESNLLINPKNLYNDKEVFGFKGFHLSGGEVAQNGEISGCLLDGNFKFYDPVIKYNGFIGNENSIENDDKYVFAMPQKLLIKMVNENTYLKSLLIYFDKECNEYATKLIFNNEVESDKIFINNNTLFMRSFRENSTLTATEVEFNEWSKLNSLVKIVKVKTGYTGLYTSQTINDLFYSNDKFSNEDELRFGVSLQTANIKFIDRDSTIIKLYNARLFFKNVRVIITVDNVIEGSFLLDAKPMGNNTTLFWELDCKDILSYKMNEIIPTLGVQIDDNGQPISKSLKYILDYVLTSIGVNIIYDDGLESELNSIMIPVVFIQPDQTRYDILLKIAQVGLLRIFTDRNGNIVVSRGL